MVITSDDDRSRDAKHATDDDNLADQTVTESSASHTQWFLHDFTQRL